MRVAGAQVLGAAGIDIAGHAEVGAGVQPVVDRGVAHRGGGGGANPGHAVVHAVVVFQAVQAHREFIGRTDPETIGGGNAFFVQTATGAVVVSFRGHGIDAQGGVFAGLDIEVARGTHIAVVAYRQGDLVFIDGAGLFAHLVDGAAGGTAPKQHGGRAAQDFQAVQVEGVTLVKRRVAHAVNEDVTGGLQRQAPQTNVFFAAFSRQKGNAAGVFECFLDGVEVAIIHELFSHYGHGLRDVTQ